MIFKSKQYIRKPYAIDPTLISVVDINTAQDMVFSI